MIIIMIIIKIQHTSAPLGGDGDRSRRLRAAMPVPAAHLHLQIFFFFCSFYSLDKNGSHDFFGVSIRIRNVHHDHKIHYQHLIFVWVYKNPNERLESCFWLGLSWISAHLSVKFSGLKICLFKNRTNIRHDQLTNTIINMIVKMMFTSYGVAGFRFLIRNVHWFSIFEAPFQNMLLIEHVYRFWKYHQSDDFVVLTFHLKKRTVFCFFFTCAGLGCWNLWDNQSWAPSLLKLTWYKFWYM